jgi:hypothetical protein
MAQPSPDTAQMIRMFSVPSAPRKTSTPAMPSFPTMAASTDAPVDSSVIIETTPSVGKYTACMGRPGSASTLWAGRDTRCIPSRRRARSGPEIWSSKRFPIRSIITFPPSGRDVSGRSPTRELVRVTLGGWGARLGRAASASGI